MSKTVTRSASFEEMQGISPSRSEADRGALDRECVAFSRYLINQEPIAYVRAKYREAHGASEFVSCDKMPGFDRLLQVFATRNRFLTKLVDSYTSMFLKTSTIRKKWILLLAILESCGPTYRYFDYPDNCNNTLLAIRTAGKVVASSLTLMLATVLFMPLHLAFKLFSRAEV